MKAEDFDKKFDDGEDISEFLDLENIRRPGLVIPAKAGIQTSDTLDSRLRGNDNNDRDEKA